jgi:hypothetical protein
MAIARRKKTVEFDGAQFIISPLTYNELEQYGELKEKFSSDTTSGKLTKGSKEWFKAARSNVFFVVRCGINNAIPEVQRLQNDRIAALEAGNRTAEVEETYSNGMRDLVGQGIAISEANLLGEMDDELATDIWREVLGFSGLEMLSKEELKKLIKENAEKDAEKGAAKSTGEAKASS